MKEIYVELLTEPIALASLWTRDFGCFLEYIPSSEKCTDALVICIIPVLLDLHESFLFTVLFLM